MFHPGRPERRDYLIRPLVGLVTVLGLVALVALTAALFRGSFIPSAPLTVLAERSGLVLNPDAKVKMLGVQIGRVAAIERQPDGTAAIQLAMDPDRLAMVPANARVDIASSTVFGAKFIEFLPPTDAADTPMRPGDVVRAERVTVEINTLFEKLSSVLAVIEPEKLNQTLGALSSALDGRGEQLGRTIADFDAVLAELEPALPSLAHDIAVLPSVSATFADVAPDLLDTAAAAASRISDSIVAEQHNLDALLVSVIGLADIGDDVLGTNQAALAETLRLFAPVTDLTNQYHPALTCGLGGLLVMAQAPPLKVPGAQVLTGFLWGQERWRYPENLPKVAAKGGPQCTNMPVVPFETRPPYLVTDTGANPWRYDNPRITWNSDALKQALFGPLDGPPRNSAQIGQPG
ncbi:virulence factor Mce family protein [Mycolicibacterium chitae]|uniref:Virulence factor Mce family protein n=1 Tax=Mycolicibacterium chitae TaxID=1792 RepID=A0A3S4RHC8_MYCCI|nr:MCE family protein [Mycolicibacterium chitae]BBZ01637.1 virulence factor Mce family protein [Mycolicibacterium chitae]VEG50473.1 Virulence factor Mce family protein [Mycolicibacterium chitae]